MGDWESLPIELLKVIAHRLEFVDDIRSFSYVCNSWKFAVFELEPWLHSKYPPCLLLAEETGLDLSAVKVSERDAILSTTPELISRNSWSFETISIRGWFSLATQKVYKINLPEATNKLILGTNKGWLLTVGKDLEINLLHPLSKHQIPLPSILSMLALPYRFKFSDYEEFHSNFITKVVMSSQVPTESALQHVSSQVPTESALQHEDTSHLPIIMAIYSDDGKLGFSRLGDHSWTNMALSGYISDDGFDDIVYHKKFFYAISFRGHLFVCSLYNKAKIITSIPTRRKGWDQCYLIESLSKSNIWVVVRFRDGEWYKTRETKRVLVQGELFYYTINFKVFELEIHSSNSGDTTCAWTRKEVKDLGNEALFIGKTSSISVASSKYIKPNSIYFTDDSQAIMDVKGGHDMGIFDVKTGIIQPHFQGISIHPFSPSLWYL